MRKRQSNPAADSSDGGGFSTSLVRGLQILRAFQVGDASLGNLEIMDRTGLPKATVSRLTYTLAALGYLNYDDTLGRYSLGSAAVALGYSALTSNAVVHVARPLMQSLADATGAAVALGARDQNEMVYLSICRSESPVTLRLNVGSRLPIWNTGMGLAYLVGLTDEERNDLKKKYMPRKLSERQHFSDILDTARAQYARDGFVTAAGHWHSHVTAVGVPFRPRDGSPPLGITCGGISEIMSKKAITELIGPSLLNLQAKVERLLSGSVEA